LETEVQASTLSPYIQFIAALQLDGRNRWRTFRAS
jgi:hypothetical protein